MSIDYRALIKEQKERIAELEANQGRANKLITELHEQVYDSSYLDDCVDLYFSLIEDK